MKAIETLSIDRASILKSEPAISVIPVGVKHLAITQNTPEY